MSESTIHKPVGWRIVPVHPGRPIQERMALAVRELFAGS
jgi:hypothetical protein